MSRTGRTDPPPAEEARPSRDLAERGPASTTHLPHKPTRDAATGASHPEQLADDHPAPAADPPAWAHMERQEVDRGSDNHPEPPHVTQNDREGGHPDEAVLPANASGSDRVPADDLKQPVDDESMYDGRPSQDKDRPPSEDAR